MKWWKLFFCARLGIMSDREYVSITQDTLVYLTQSIVIKTPERIFENLNKPSYLHDERAVLVAVLVQGVQLGNGVVKSLLGKLTGLVWAVEDLIVKHGEVESQAQPNGVGWLHLGLADLESVLVSFLGIVNNGCKE